MSNTITEMKNTLEGINNRITEAEERISDLGDKMVEISAKEQNKEKRKKRIEDNLETSGTKLNAPIFELSGPRRRREKERD